MKIFRVKSYAFAMLTIQAPIQFATGQHLVYMELKYKPFVSDEDFDMGLRVYVSDIVKESRLTPPENADDPMLICFFIGHSNHEYEYVEKCCQSLSNGCDLHVRPSVHGTYIDVVSNVDDWKLTAPSEHVGGKEEVVVSSRNAVNFTQMLEEEDDALFNHRYPFEDRRKVQQARWKT
uniref:AlNc14C110G6346 protein n=1 Tax=Albugo laibachii Nc14 TaxID=890382 RepID=F0WIE7_9STRA|nr:AlNc14C110G6346 [Albugo laibachii Nc14]|eukprot:CCA21028.1 AlNc14C110G6346 [Albugo laibachii Nc14]